MDEPTIAFLKRVYKEYYFRHPDRIEFPTEMEKREFGYIPFGGTMIRHLSFKAPGELAAELLRQAPSSVYCSNATYAEPTLPMEEKGWKGAELIFDIDADSIPTSCKTRHRWWQCQGCQTGGKGSKPSQCSNCKSMDVAELHWACRECLDATREHVTRLRDFLVKDFGVMNENIKLYFSGNRGYHVSVGDDDERFNGLNPQARAEIANYIRGSGISIRARPPNTGTYGWNTRLAIALESLNSQAQSGSRTKRAPNPQKIIEEAVKRNAALIDQSVTTDVHRIFRMPGTLHGTSGMLKMRVDSLKDFNPLNDPVVLSDAPVELYVDFSPDFILKGEKFGPYASAKVKLATYAAVFLLAKGLARVRS